MGGPFPSPGDLPNPGMEPRSPALQADSPPAEPQGSLLAERGCFILPSVTSSRQGLSWSVSRWRWRQHLRGITRQGLGERSELRPRLLSGHPSAGTARMSAVFLGRHRCCPAPRGAPLPPPSLVAGKESACDAGDPGSVPGSGRSPGEGNGNPLQCSFLENPTDRGAWWAAVLGVAELDTTE